MKFPDLLARYENTGDVEPLVSILDYANQAKKLSEERRIEIGNEISDALVGTLKRMRFSRLGESTGVIDHNYEIRFNVMYKMVEFIYRTLHCSEDTLVDARRFYEAVIGWHKTLDGSFEVIRKIRKN